VGKTSLFKAVLPELDKPYVLMQEVLRKAVTLKLHCIRYL